MISRLRGEADTIGFLLGFGLIVAGAALIYLPAALLLAGALICSALIVLRKPT